MGTPTVTVVPPDPAGLWQAVERLREGKVVCFPTESFYALGVPAVGGAIDDIIRAKVRLPTQPIACVAASADVATTIWKTPVPPRALALGERHWPKALTIVAPGIDGLRPELLGPAGVGVRVSSHPIVRALCDLLAGKVGKGPAAVLTATSANRHGEPPARTVAEARRRLAPIVDFFIDGGETPGGSPSTIVEVLAGGGARVVRPGAVTLSSEELA